MLIFDLETVPRVDLSEACILHRYRNIKMRKVPKSYKDPIKIAEKKLEVKKMYDDDCKNIGEMDALDPLYGRIMAIGHVQDDGKIKARTTIIDEQKGATPLEAEKTLLQMWFKYLANEQGPVIGYNIEGFDLPMLTMRAIAHGLKIPFVIQSKQKVDLMKAMTGFQWKREYKGQVETCLSLGMDVDMSIINSAEMYERYVKYDTEWVLKHLKQDVKMSFFLFNKLKLAGVMTEHGI